MFDQNSRILILGSFPSVKSREADFYYAHPKNRFWPLLARIYEKDLPLTTDERKSFALKNGIALYDTIEECDIIASSDSSIKNAVPVDIMRVLDTAEIKTIYCNGATSFDLYKRLVEPITGRAAVKLPSTSPANAAWSEDRLFDEWKIIRY